MKVTAKSLNLYKYMEIVEFIRTKRVAAARGDNKWAQHWKGGDFPRKTANFVKIRFLTIFLHCFLGC